MTSELSSKDSSKLITASVRETCQKVKAAVLPAIDSHVNNEEFTSKDGLDFLDVKNSLLLSYLIDLTVYVRDRNNGKENEKNLRRLTEMKTVLDKMKGLDKKLRYQIEKLLAANTTATAFASGGDNRGPEDPLQFRPDLKSLENDEAGSDSDESDGDGSEPDDDLAAARATLSMTKGKKSRNDENEDDGIYRAPRTTAVPYALDLEEKRKEKEKRSNRRLRASELAQTLRAQYGDAPEQEDFHGGSEYGKQRAASRRLAEREAEKTRYEEDAMIRLTTTRKEKKERKRQMQMESSNLSAIADLGNLVRETQAFGKHSDDEDDEPVADDPSSKRTRYDNGKRRREPENVDGYQRSRGKMGKAKNSLQAALYGGGGGGGASGKKKKSRR